MDDFLGIFYEAIILVFYDEIIQLLVIQLKPLVMIYPTLKQHFEQNN